MQFSLFATVGVLIWTALADPAPAPTAAPEAITGVQRRMFSGTFPGVTASIGWNGSDFLKLASG
jgi:hypothetical protein